MTEYEYEQWFAAKGLGPLEDVRDYVDLHARQNGYDAEDPFACAKETVEMYLDDPEMAKEFDYYRP